MLRNGPIVLAVFAVILTAAPAKSSEFDALSELSKYLGGSISIEVKDGMTRLSYCPDNTCDIFTRPAHRDVDTLIEFTYLYYVFVLSYYYPEVEAFRENQPVDQVRRLLERHATGCEQAVEYVRCVILSMAETYEIGLKGYRIDEGSGSEWPSNMRSKVGQHLIQSMVRRYAL